MAGVGGGIGFLNGAFKQMIEHGWEDAEARCPLRRSVGLDPWERSGRESAVGGGPRLRYVNLFTTSRSISSTRAVVKTPPCRNRPLRAVIDTDHTRLVRCPASNAGALGREDGRGV